MLPKPIIPPRKPRGRQKESANQREFVRALNATGEGFFYRVKNMGTFDPVRKIYRKDYGTALVAIPDICGYLFNHKVKRLDPIARPVYIEVKNIERVEARKKLIFAVKITDQQKEFLLRAHNSGCLAGVAFTYEDCLAIVKDDPVRYPRHPRTYCFMPRPWLEEYAVRYAEEKKALSRLKQDPVAAVTVLAGTQEPSE